MAAACSRSRSLITGLSATGKSTVLAALKQLGHRVVEAGEGWCGWLSYGDVAPGWIWDEGRTVVLGAYTVGTSPAGCLIRAASLSALTRSCRSGAPAEVILERLANALPLLRASAAREITAKTLLTEVVAQPVASGELAP